MHGAVKYCAVPRLPRNPPKKHVHANLTVFRRSTRVIQRSHRHARMVDLGAAVAVALAGSLTLDPHEDGLYVRARDMGSPVSAPSGVIK